MGKNKTNVDTRAILDQVTPGAFEFIQNNPLLAYPQGNGSSTPSATPPLPRRPAPPLPSIDEDDMHSYTVESDVASVTPSDYHDDITRPVPSSDMEDFESQDQSRSEFDSDAVTRSYRQQAREIIESLRDEANPTHPMWEEICIISRMLEFYMDDFADILVEYKDLMKPSLRIIDRIVRYSIMFIKANGVADLIAKLATFAVECGFYPQYEHIVSLVRAGGRNLNHPQGTGEETLRGIEEAEENVNIFKAFTNSESMSKLRDLFEWTVIYPIAKASGIPEVNLGYGSFNLRHKDKEFKSKQGNIVLDLIQSLLYVLRKGTKAIVTGNFKHFIHKDDAFLSWAEQYDELIKYENKLSHVQKDGYMEKSVYITKMRDAIKSSTVLIEKLKGQKDRNYLVVRQYVEKLNAISHKLFIRGKAGESRDPPKGILIYGPPSIGKTAISEMLFEWYAKIMKKTYRKEENLYTRNPEDKFWSGYHEGQFCVMIDDIAKFRQDKTPDPSLLELIAIMNGVAFITDQADLADKGNVFFKSEIVIATTNTKNLNAWKVYEHSAAALRRLPFVVTARVKHEYATPGNALDSSKVPHDADIPDYWEYCVEMVVMRNGKAHYQNLDGEVHEEQTPEIWLDMDDFFMVFKKFVLDQEAKNEKVRASSQKISQMRECEHGRLAGVCFICKHEEKYCPHDNFRGHCDTCYADTNPYTNMDTDVFKYDVFEPNEPQGMVSDSALKLYLRFRKYQFKKRLKDTNIILRPAMHAAHAIETRAITDNWENFLRGKPTVFDYLFDLGDVEPTSKVGKAIWHAKKQIVKARRAVTVMPPMAKKVIMFLGMFLAAFQMGRMSNRQKKTKALMSPQHQESESDSSGYDSNTSSLKDIWSKVENRYPLFRSNNAQSDTLAQKAARSIYSMGVHAGEKRINSANATCIGGELFITCAHLFLVDGKVQYPYTLTLLHTTHSKRLSNSVQCMIEEHQIVFDFERDLAMFVAPLPPGGNLMKFCAPKVEPFVGKRAAIAFIKNKHDLSVSRYNVNLDYQDRVQFEMQNGIEEKVQMLYHNKVFDKGDCGNPVILASGSDIGFLGIHNGGTNSHSCVIWVTKEHIDRMKKKLLHNGVCIFQGDIPEDRYPDLQLTDIHNKSIFSFVENTGHVKIHGEVVGPRIKGKSKVASLPLKERMDEIFGSPCKYSSPIMHKGYYMVEEELTYLSPYGLALASTVSSKPCMPDSIALKARNAYIKRINSQKLEVSIHKPLDLYTAINGHKDFKYIDSINKSTSAGYPFKGNKTQLFDPAPTVQAPDGVFLKPQYHKMAIEMIASYERGETVRPIFQSHLKDEPVSERKKKKGKTRMFSAADCVWCIVTRCYFLPLIKLINENRDLFECAVGTNVYSLDWDKMYKRLTGPNFKNRQCDGDYVGFDKNMRAGHMRHGFIAMDEIVRHHLDYSEVDHLVMSAIGKDITFPLTIFDGVLVVLFGSNPSGNPLTTIINSIVNSLYIRMGYFICRGELDTFDKYIIVYTYGDDNVFAVHVLCEGFDHTLLSEALRLIGIEYTMAEKEAKSVPFVGPDKISFLKRHWVWDAELKKYKAPLDIASIQKMVSYTLKSNVLSPWQQQYDNMESALRELAHYSRDTFEEYRTQFSQLVIDNSSHFGFHGDIQEFPTYNILWDLDAEHINEYQGLGKVTHVEHFSECREKYPDVVSRRTRKYHAPVKRGYKPDKRHHAGAQKYSSMSKLDFELGLTQPHHRNSCVTIQTNKQKTRMSTRNVSGHKDMTHLIERCISKAEIDYELISALDRRGLFKYTSIMVSSAMAKDMKRVCKAIRFLHNDLSDSRDVVQRYEAWNKFHSILLSHMTKQDKAILLKGIAERRRRSIRVQPQADVEPVTSEEQNVAFTDSAPDMTHNIVSAPADTLKSITKIAPLADVLKRPVIVHTHSWQPGDTIREQFNVWRLFFQDSVVKRYTENFRYFSGSLKIKVVINGSPFHMGRLMVSYNPLAVGDTNSYPARDASVPLTAITDIMLHSQRPHVTLNPTTNCICEMVLPFVWPTDKVKANDASELNALGTLYTTSLGTLEVASDSTTPVDITIFAFMDDIDLSMPFTPQGDEYTGSGAVSAPASAVANLASKLSDAPVIGRFAQATSLTAGAVANVAKLFGFSRPVVIDKPTFVLPLPVNNMANDVGDEAIFKLTLDPKQGLSVDPQVTGDGEDEMTIASIASREAIFTTFNWSTANAPEVSLLTLGVCPHICYRTGTSPIYQLAMPPLTLASMPFSKWRGTLIYKFTILCSNYHRGRLKITYDPGSLNGANTNAMNTNYSAVVDLRDTQEFEVKIGWAQACSYMNTRTSMEYGDAVTFSNNVGKTFMNQGEMQRCVNGYLKLKVLNRLTAPKDGNVQIYVSVRAGDDFEVAVPGPVEFISPMYTPQARTLVKPQMMEEEMPDNPTQIDLVKGEDDPHRNLVYMGERVTSFRAYLKRYMLDRVIAVPISSTVSGIAVYYMNLPNIPCQYGQSPEYDYPQVNPVITPVNVNGNKPNFFQILQSCYVGYKGSMRWKYVHRNSNANAYVTRNQIVTYASGSTSAANTAFSTSEQVWPAQLTLNNYGIMGGMISGADRRSVEVEVPMQMNVKFCRARDLMANYDASIDVLPIEADKPVTNNHRYSYESSDSTGIDYVNAYFATGEDFSFNFFVGVPLLSQYQIKMEWDEILPA